MDVLPAWEQENRVIKLDIKVQPDGWSFDSEKQEFLSSLYEEMEENIYSHYDVMEIGFYEEVLIINENEWLDNID